MILPKIALRNLSRQKRRSILLGSALAFGMFILVVVNGITGGLVSSIQKNFSDLYAAHIFFLQVEKSDDGKLLDMITDDSALLDAIEKSGFRYKSMSRRTSSTGTVIFSGESSTRMFTGVDWNEETELGANLKLLAGDASKMAGSDGIIITLKLAEDLGLLPKKSVSYTEKALMRRDLRIRLRASGKPFDIEKELDREVKRIETENRAKQLEQAPGIIGESLLVELSTIYGQQNVGEFRIAGIFEAQMDITAYVDREVLNGMIAMPKGSYNLFGLVLDDYSNLAVKTTALYGLLKDKYNLVPMEKVNGKAANALLSDIKKEDFTGSKTIVTNLNNELGSIVSILSGVQAGSFLLFLVVIAMVMVGLVNTYRIIVYERTKEIGTMRAVGTQRAQIRNLFLLEALFLALAGTVAGSILGIAALNVIHLFELSSMAEMSYFLDNGHLAFTISGGLLFASFLTVIFFTLIAAMMPARKAAKMQPAQALRSQF